MKQKKRNKKKERKGNALRIGFNINWPKYLFSRIFSLSVQSLHRRIASLAASVNIEYIQIVLHRREEKTLKREREVQIFSEGYY